MSVVPMKLLTMAGPLERFDEVVRTCVIDQLPLRLDAPGDL